MTAPASSEHGSPVDETQRLKQEVDELTALFEITKRLRRPFELSSLLEEILLICRDLTNAEAASLLLLDDTGKWLDFILVRGGPERKLMNLPPISVGEGIAGWVAQTGDSVIVNDTRTDERFSNRVDTQTHFKTHSVLAAPLRTDEGILGVVEVINKKDNAPFTTDDQRLFEMMAEQAAVAYQHVSAQQQHREEDRMVMIGRMASAIIHDLKNPMTAIKGFAELIRAQTPDASRFCEIIIREIDRLVEMTHELLDFSKGIPDLDPVEMEIRTFIEELVEVLRPDFEASEISLLVDLRWDGKISLDPNKLRRVIFNLASNARDAMPDGGSFTIKVEQERRGVEVSLTDTGCGMDEKTRLSCFETFYSSGKQNGTGLGLAIVKMIVRAHQGAIDVNSQPGRGTTFRIWLPSQQINT